MSCLLIKDKKMSRIGENPITIPEGVNVNISDGVVSVKGSLGELTQAIIEGIKVSVNENLITLERSSNQKDQRSLHGLYRALIANMIEGVTKGYTKKLELVGVGYRASNQGQKLDISVGYSHNIIFEVPNEVKVSTESEKGKAPVIILNSHDKQLIGAVAAKIRSFRKPEPYKGKGIRFVGEQIRRKAGKTAAAGA
jgi:large subunit ribosomal protein L6|tara:strand:+ start:2360 stop:2947 length:588 start_codon:yes stop_codon:yes gene_type:complete